MLCQDQLEANAAHIDRIRKGISIKCYVNWKELSPLFHVTNEFSNQLIGDSIADLSFGEDEPTQPTMNMVVLFPVKI